MLGDIFSCLLVAFRLFVVLVLIINVLAWLLFGDDDDENIDRPVQRHVDGPPYGQPVCITRPVLARLPVTARCRRPPPEPENDGSPSPESASGVEALLDDIVEKLADEKRSTGAADNTSAVDAEFSETDSVDTKQNVGQELMMAPVSITAFELDSGGAGSMEEQSMVANRRHDEVLSSQLDTEYHQTVLSTTEEQQRDSEMDDRGISLDDDERATATESATSSMIEASQGVTAAESAGSEDTPKPSTPRAQLQSSAPRRPASHL